MERFENQDPIRQGRGAGRGFGMGRGRQEDQEASNTGSAPEQQENRGRVCRCGRRGARGQGFQGNPSFLAQDQPRSTEAGRGPGQGRGFRRGAGRGYCRRDINSEQTGS